MTLKVNDRVKRISPSGLKLRIGRIDRFEKSPGPLKIVHVVWEGYGDGYYYVEHLEKVGENPFPKVDSSKWTGRC